MKRILLMALACIGIQAGAQNITVRDKTTREPIPEVTIKDKNNVMVTSDVRGKADVSALDKTDSVVVTHVSYGAKKALLSTDATELNLTAKVFVLDEIIFSANRTREKKIDVPYTIEIIKQKDIEFGNQPTSGDVLANTGNIFLQKSQLGGGSPSLRGFEASRVLIVVDGVRMNNAIYRAGHLQDVMTLDAQMLDRTEIVFGPASTMYGSDALGGVMHFYTKNAQFSSDDRMLLKVNAMGRFASVNQEQTGHIDLNLGWKKFASITNITHSTFGDLMSGGLKLAGYTNKWDRDYFVDHVNDRDTMVKNSNNNLLVGSGYKQTDIMQRFSLKTGEHMTHHLNFQMSLAPQLPRYDRLAGDYKSGNLRFAENHYNQNRLLGAYTFNFDGKTPLSDNIKIIFAYQKLDQDRTTREFKKTDRITQMEDVVVRSANIDIVKTIRERHELRYGLELTANDVKSTANTRNIKTDSVFAADTRYASSGTMNTAAIYVSHAFEVNRNFVITDGLRFTGTALHCDFSAMPSFTFPFSTADQKNQALTGSLGFTWKAENDYKVSLVANTGFRSPNIDDLSKVFDKATLIVPNPDIKPEYAYNFEMGISKVMDHRYKLDVSVYYTVLENAMTVRDFKYLGQDSAVYNGSTYKVQAMQNADKAYIYGTSVGCQLDFNENISFKATINYTYGRYIDSKNDTVVPLDHIAPLFGTSSLIYKARNTDAEFFVRFNARKNLPDYSPSGEDNLQYATTTGMPGWFTLNLRVGYNITKNIRINAACENITDNRYRVFASGINAPGRNFIVSLRFKL